LVEHVQYAEGSRGKLNKKDAKEFTKGTHLVDKKSGLVLFQHFKELPMGFSNWLGGTLSGPKRPIFRHTAHNFFDLSAAMACKNSLRLAKNDLFFVLDATTPTSYGFL
jgi:hypothetical protein